MTRFTDDTQLDALLRASDPVDCEAVHTASTSVSASALRDAISRTRTAPAPRLRTVRRRVVTASAELRELHDCEARLAVPAPTLPGAITASGHAQRRHRLFALVSLSALGATAATALVIALAGVLGSSPAPATNGATVASGANRSLAPATIRTAAFTIARNHDGTVTLTINPGELFDATALQTDLAKYGIPALVTTDRFCTSDPAPAGLSQVMSYQPGADATVTIDPAAMPAGTELSIGTLQLKGGDVRASFAALIDTSAHTCTSNPLTDAGPQSAHDVFFQLGPTIKGATVQRSHAGS